VSLKETIAEAQREYASWPQWMKDAADEVVRDFGRYSQWETLRGEPPESRRGS
jgi:hypothetical protein